MCPKFLTAGAQQNLWGTCKKVKRLMKKPNIQQRKCSACHSLATDTLPLINSFVDHTAFYYYYVIEIVLEVHLTN